jgi:hypothetical protein
MIWTEQLLCLHQNSHLDLGTEVASSAGWRYLTPVDLNGAIKMPASAGTNNREAGRKATSCCTAPLLVPKGKAQSRIQPREQNRAIAAWSNYCRLLKK